VGSLSALSKPELQSIRGEGAILDEAAQAPMPLPACNDKAITDSTPQAVQTSARQSYTCAECSLIVGTQTELEGHADRDGHKPWACPEPGCDVKAARKDSLGRHMQKHSAKSPAFPCLHCSKYRGSTAFRRKDHLQQHLRSKHPTKASASRAGMWSSCPHDTCNFYRGSEVRPERAHWHIEDRSQYSFKTAKDAQQHMRKDHSESPFPCLARDCELRGRKGYFSLKALESHQREEHPDEAVMLRRTKEQWYDTVPPYFRHYVPRYETIGYQRRQQQTTQI